MGSSVEFTVCARLYCVAKLPCDADLTAITGLPQILSLTRDEDEVSILAEEPFAWKGAEIERGWRGLKVKGPLDFALTGILASLLKPLDEAGVSVFVISTFSTDYVFVKGDDLSAAIAALETAGHRRIHG